MSAWIVYSKDGSTERCRLKELEYSGSFMNERTVTATFEYESEVAFDVFDYIEYRGEKFELEAIPSVKKTSSHNYEYELRFVSLKYELERCEMRDIVPNDNRVVYPTPLTFSFTGNVKYLAERIQANLDALYGTGVWSIIVAEGVTSEDKNITISQQNCWNALSLVNTTYELDFTVKGRVVNIGGNKPSISHVFQYGKGKGLYEIERSADTGTGIVTKLRAYGGTKNLDYSYPKKPEWGDSVLGVSFVLSPLRLMLPSFKKDGKTDYILADEATIAEYGIREASVIYDDIYPSITGAKNSQGQSIDEIMDVEAVDDTKSTFVVFLHDLEFDLESHLTTANAQISMKSGAMQGYTFNISEIEKRSDNSYKITLGRITTDTSDTGNYEIPNSSWNMAAGDKFVFLNILMPQEYIRKAENRLLERAKEYLAEYGKTNFSYNVGLHDKFLIENSDIFSSLVEGAKLTIHDEVLGISEDVTIQSISITENAEDNILPQVKITLNNKPSASTLDRIQGQIKELSETTSGTFSSQSELLKQYRKKLDKPFFDRLFVAVGLDGKELASTDTNSPIAYIKAKYSFATIGGITMYAQDSDIDIPTIAEGLPFDEKTIWFNPTTKQIEVIGGTGGGSGEGGVSSFWELNGIPTWVTIDKPVYSYSEIKNTPDLSVYALKSAIPSLSGYATESWVLGKGYATTSDLDGRINALINGAPQAYDTLKEIADVLQGNVNSIGDIITTLGGKADKATTLGGYGIIDAYTKTNVDNLLKSYVTLAGTQTITGEKDFTGGLKVNGSPLVYNKESGYWKLEGDLLVTGGVRMYSSDTAFTPSTIMDAIVVDGVTITKQGGKLVALGGGTADAVAWGNISGKPSWITNSVPVIGISGVNVSLGGSITQSALRTALGLGSNAYSSTDYLPLSGGTLENANGSPLRINSTHQGGSAIVFLHNGADKSWFGYDKNVGRTYMYNTASQSYLGVRDNGTPYFNSYTLWHSGNDGSGSGLDADLLDGKHNGELTALYVTSQNVTTDNFSTYLNTYGNQGLSVLTNVSGSDVGDIPSISAVLNIGGTATRLGRFIFMRNDNSDGLWWQSANSAYNAWGTKRKVAFVDSNVASATKLQTTRTIWGQSFDGTGDIDGKLILNNNIALCGKAADGTDMSLLQTTANNNLSIGLDTSAKGYSTYISGNNIYLRYGTSRTNGIILNSSGNVTIGSSDLASTSAKLYVDGLTKITSSTNIGLQIDSSYKGEVTRGVQVLNPSMPFGDSNGVVLLFGQSTSAYNCGNIAYRHHGENNTNNYVSLGLYGKDNILVCKANGNVGIDSLNPTAKLDVNGTVRATNYIYSDSLLWFKRGSEGVYMGHNAICWHNSGAAWVSNLMGFESNKVTINQSTTVQGDILSTGGITMYSDARKKTILNHVELSLQQVANAPLIEHYYNSDQNKTIHVGSIAQYWYDLNDWFCKEDNEGFLTMEIQNAALASAISVARELVKFESETDRRIRLLEDENKRLKEEVEQLKWNIA